MGRVKQMLIEQEDMKLETIQVYIQDRNRDLTIDEARDLHAVLGHLLMDYDLTKET